MTYIVIAVGFGDGEGDHGGRIWSQEFRTRRAAEEAATWLQKNRTVIGVKIIEDNYEI